MLLSGASGTYTSIFLLLLASNLISGVFKAGTYGGRGAHQNFPYTVLMPMQLGVHGILHIDAFKGYLLRFFF